MLGSIQHSLSQTVNHDKCGQTPAKQKHHQEKEGGGGGAKGLQCWPTVIEECDLRRKVAMEREKRVSDNTRADCWWIMLVTLKQYLHLLAVEEDDKLDGIDAWQQGAKKSPCPNNSLTINKPKHIGRYHKLLPTHPLSQLTGPVVHHNPDTCTQNTSQSCSQTFYWFNKISILFTTDKLGFIPAWKLHQGENSNSGEEVKQCQLVHLLSYTCFPALHHDTNMQRLQPVLHSLHEKYIH